MHSTKPAPDPTAGSGARGAADALRCAIEAAEQSLLQRRGMLLLHGPDPSTRPLVLERLGARLPADYLWTVLRGPVEPTDIWASLLGAPPLANPSREASEAIFERARRGIWTVLAIDGVDCVSHGVLAILEELAGLEPMLQLVLSSALDVRVSARGPVAQRLALRVRNTIAVPTGDRTPAPVRVSGSEPESAAGSPSAATVAPRQHRPAASPHSMAAPSAIPPLEEHSGDRDDREVVPHGDRGRGQDPFRESPTQLSIDCPELLPVLSNPHGLHAEWFRILQLRVHDWIRAEGGTPKAIAITGPDVNAGKTFVAANLALLWASASYERVLLVDADLRRPQFHGLFEIPRRPGFADLLARRCGIEDSVAFVSEVGLHVMSAGRPGNPRHLVNPGRMQHALAAMREAYDVVIIDGPPLKGLVDSRSLAAGCDGVLMVVRAGETRLPSLKRAMDFLPTDNLIGAVVNAATTDVQSAYSQYRKTRRG